MHLDEDIGAGDLATMATIAAEAQGKGLFRAKKDGVVAGLVLLERIFYFIDHRVAGSLAHQGRYGGERTAWWSLKRWGRCARCCWPSGPRLIFCNAFRHGDA